MKTVTVFKGDGIGPEITDAVLKILKAAKAPLSYEIYQVGLPLYEQSGELVSEEAFASFERTRVLLKSPITTPVGSGFRSINVMLRKKFRENTEDLYVGVEEQIDENTVHATKIITRSASERIIRDAFAYARANHRRRVTCVHKANILKMSDGLFLSVFKEIAAEYPDITADDRIVDNMCMQLVQHPQQYDVLVMPNLYGDILSDLTSGLIGGLGLMPSANLGSEYAMFEAVHGSAPDIAGRHIANPTALLWSACMMLDHLDEQACAQKIKDAVNQVLMDHEHLTPDLGGSATTEEYTQAIIDALAE